MGRHLWRHAGQTWKGLLLEDTQVQQGAYCVRRSGRQEELDDLSAVFGHEVFTLLCVALGYEVTDLLHELHQSFLQGSDGKVMMRHCVCFYVFIFLTAQLTSVILVGNRVSSFLMMNRQKEQVGSSRFYGEEPLVILLAQKQTLYFYLIEMHFCFRCTHIGTAGSGSVFIDRKLGKFHKFLLFGATKSKNCTRLLWLLKSINACRVFHQRWKWR